MDIPSDRSAARRTRFGLFWHAAGVREDNPQTRHIYQRMEKRFASAEQKAEARRYSKRAIAIATAEILNGPGLPVDKYIREFAKEYNNRTFMTYGSEQPSSFNVMQGFLEPAEEAMILKILPEHYYQFDLADYLDLVTSSGVPSANLTDLEELEIREFNQVGGPVSISLPDLEGYFFGGLAFVRHGREICVMAVFGEPPVEGDSETFSGEQPTYTDTRPFLGDSPVDYAPEDFFGIEGVAPLIILMRVDASSKEFETRFVMRERKGAFSVYLDDPDLIEETRPLLRGDFDEWLQRHKAAFDRYQPLFYLVQNLLDIPSYAEMFDDEAAVERHPTGIRLKNSVRLDRVIADAPRVYRPLYRQVLTLSSSRGSQRKHFDLDTTGLRRDTSGYWKHLAGAMVGKDKAGRDLHGKTWVSKDLTWFELNPSGKGDRVDIDIGDSQADEIGYIYVMRTPMHAKDVIKIGWTSKTSEERAEELSATTGQPDKFFVLEDWKVRQPRSIERRIHNALADRRLKYSREFFQGRYKDIRRIIEDIIGDSVVE